MRLAWLILVATACSSSAAESKKGDTASADGPKALEHEKCDDSMGRVQVTDSVAGKPALKQIFDKTSGRELCRISDLNHDGKPDMYEYYNADGTLRRREGAYDNTDAISQVGTYEGGKLVKLERDTTGQRKIDTWDTYDPATGKLTKRERDNNGDGKVDQWWTFEPNGNATIAIDKNGDGQPDPGETITVGPNGQAIAPAPSASAQNNGDAGAAAPPPPPAPPVLYTQPPPTVHGKKKPGAKK
ncbi:MAG TPA: hypothetical protein VGH28_16505 [Polyangiaceae bacterium]